MEREVIQQQLDHVLMSTDFSDWLGPKHEGKARDNYVRNGQRFMITTDRISAFDQHIGCIPFKGQILTQMAAFWFEQTKDIVDNHVLAAPDPNVLAVKECTPLPVEMVVRGYLTGVTPTSIWYQYQRGNREFCGHRLPDGMRKNHRLPEPIITPSTKAPKGQRDQSISGQDVLQRELVDETRFAQISEIALAVFDRGTKVAAERGYILVDTKYEFGLDGDGQVVLIDEIHTPDSSRFWPLDTYDELFAQDKEQNVFDKEFVRLWLAGQGFDGDGPVPKVPGEVLVDAAERYIKIFEEMTRQTLQASVGDPTARIEDALKSYVASGASVS